MIQKKPKKIGEKLAINVTRMKHPEDHEEQPRLRELARRGIGNLYFHEWAQQQTLYLGGWQYQHLNWFAIEKHDISCGCDFRNVRFNVCLARSQKNTSPRYSLPLRETVVIHERNHGSHVNMIQNRSPDTFKRYLSTWGTARPPLPPLMGLAPLLSRAKAFHLGNIPCGGTTRHDINRNRGVHWKSPSGVYWWIWSNLKEPLWIHFCVLLFSIITAPKETTSFDLENIPNCLESFEENFHVFSAL